VAELEDCVAVNSKAEVDGVCWVADELKTDKAGFPIDEDDKSELCIAGGVEIEDVSGPLVREM
jgi:hypothetical protein